MSTAVKRAVTRMESAMNALDGAYQEAVRAFAKHVSTVRSEARAYERARVALATELSELADAAADDAAHERLMDLVRALDDVEVAPSSDVVDAHAVIATHAFDAAEFDHRALQRLLKDIAQRT